MVRVVLCGVGAIGTEILKYLLERHHEIVGVVDSDPEKVGRTVAELTGLPLGIPVRPDLSSVQLVDAEVVVFSTRSRISDMAPEIMRAVNGGADVVTTSEEMAFPQHAGVESAHNIEALALEKGVTVVGVGVNPGFVMDWVPALVASASKNPVSIHVVRSVDVSRRRRQLQTKTGVGLSRAKFEKELSEGKMGHVGLAESAHLIALSLGKELVGTKEGVFPVLGSEDYVMGVRQFVEGMAGSCLIRLDLEMTMTSADFDVVEVKGEPSLKVRFEKGVFGDSATVALTVHAVERVSQAKPGLITVLDLPLSRMVQVPGA
jgi:4-hydroxy-tetrahydrodipicolinate reductase